jgi:hypothetical protein
MRWTMALAQAISGDDVVALNRDGE